MHYTSEIIINRSKDDVVAFWLNEENIALWQDGFLNKIIISGEEFAKGSKSKLVYLNKNRPMELEETILSSNLPEEIVGLYVHKHMTNTMKTNFVELSKNETIYRTEVNYIKFNGIIPKLMGFFFSKMFKKQSDKWLLQFKIACESQA